MYNCVMLWVKGLSIIYKSTGQKVLNGLSFQVKKGETVAILGPSGCGKTTLLNYLQGVLTEKEIKVSGELTITENAVIRTVFQEPRLLPWRNSQDNVAFGLEAKGTEKSKAQIGAKKALNAVGLKKSAGKYPFQLSLGMQQRVNFARALVLKPDLLLMDEPFSALDSKTKAEIIAEFKRIIKKENITTIFVTHDKKEAETLANRIISLEENITVVKENKPENQFLDQFDYLLEGE